MIAKGATAEVYEYEEGKICKLFFEGYPVEYINIEYQNAKVMFYLNLNVPKPFEVVTMDNRTAIIYERIYGKTLWEIWEENEDKKNEGLDVFVQIHKELLSHHSKDVLSYKEFLTGMLRGKSVESQELYEEINALPDGDSILHGDFHPGNILVKVDGTPIIIDFMNICYGPQLYDIARTFFLLTYHGESVAKSYLNKMQVSEDEIQTYLHIIKTCRQYEA